MFKAVRFVFQYLPLILTAMTLIESLVDKSVTGVQKKALVVAKVKEVLLSLGVILTPELEKVMRSAIDLIVSVLNALGVFQGKDSLESALEGGVDQSAIKQAIAGSLKSTNTPQADIDAQLDLLEAKLANG